MRVLFLMLCLPMVSWGQSAKKFPTSEKFKAVDLALEKFCAQIDAGAATLAISRDKELLHTFAYGKRDAAKKLPTQPDTLFRIASVTKPITASMIYELIRQKKISKQTKVVEYLKIPPPKDVKPDPDWNLITVEMLLKHEGGWDRDKSFDPMFRIDDVQDYLQLKRSVQPTDVIRYMLNQPFQFKPGSKSVYSNFGYCILGRVIEKSTGKSYYQSLQEQIFKPNLITDIKLARNDLRQRDPKEVAYTTKDVNVEVMDSHGGLIASTPALCQWLDAYWMDGQRSQPGQWGDWTFFGSLPSCTAMVRQRKEGYNLAVLINTRRNASFNPDNADLKKLMEDAMAGIK